VNEKNDVKGGRARGNIVEYDKAAVSPQLLITMARGGRGLNATAKKSAFQIGM